MISLDRASYQVQPRYAEYAGLSTDVKPVEVDNGDEFQEINTGFVYKFDETGSEWVKQPTGGGGGGGTNDYNDLINLPQINGVTLTGNKTTEQLGIDIPIKLPNPFALTFTGGATGAYDGSQAVSVEIPEPGGTTDYNDLTNLPQINGVELIGNKTSTDLKIETWEEIGTVPLQPDVNLYNLASVDDFKKIKLIIIRSYNASLTGSISSRIYTAGGTLSVIFGNFSYGGRALCTISMEVDNLGITGGYIYSVNNLLSPPAPSVFVSKGPGFGGSANYVQLPGDKFSLYAAQPELCFDGTEVARLYGVRR